MKNTATPIFAVLLLLLLLAACQPVVPTPLATAIPTPQANEPAALSAQAKLADKLGTAVDKITIVKVQAGLWPDSCLGLGSTDEVCAKVMTSGFLVTLLADGQTYQYRTDLNGSTIRQVLDTAETPPAVLAARKALADQLKLDPTAVAIVKVESIDWPDACLGVETPGVSCAQVITSGYRVILSAAGQAYEVHTNQDGTQVVQAVAAAPQSSEPVIVLKTTNAMGACEQSVVTLSGAGAAGCDEKVEIIPFPGMQRSVELNLWLMRYASFAVKGKDGSLSFTGNGTQTAELDEQRALIAWTRLAAMDTSGVPADSTTGLLIDWRRTGGIAGVCNRLMIYESGIAYARKCDLTALGQALLPTEQIRLLYNWRDNLASALITASDNVTDGFNYELQFNGAGSQSPDSTTRQSMLVLAAQLYALLLQ